MLLQRGDGHSHPMMNKCEFDDALLSALMACSHMVAERTTTAVGLVLESGLKKLVELCGAVVHCSTRRLISRTTRTPAAGFFF